MCWHKYTMWIDISIGEIQKFSYSLNKYVTIGTAIRQQKRCTKCNKLKQRLAKVTL
jgi:hypothetical protein